MPGGDRTGPNGQGPLTGRRMGYCTANPDFPANFRGLGMGRGMRAGFGRGFRHGFTPAETENYSQKANLKAELEKLKAQMEFLENELKKLD
ncbi:MAG: DUF5320 domain-containing protein [Bacteroidetes bacterium]|nr:DUF5320 domain-containing protein [Bacteroidota bacterium]